MVKRAALLAFVVTLVLTVGCGTTGPTPAARLPSTDTPPSPTMTPTVPPTVKARTGTPQPPPATAPPVPTTESSSTGGRIAFYSERDGNAEIYTMNPDGSDPRRLTFNQFEDTSPAWSPDGGQIAFVSDREDPQPGECFPNCFYQLYVISGDGSDEHRLAETDFATQHPDWHPDGTRLSFDSELNLQGDIYVVDADGSGLRLLIEDGFWADWSPDGTQIAFASNRDGNVEIYVADADGSNQRRLTENARLEYFPAWSPDGRRIAFATLEQKQIYIMNADGSNEQQLTDQGLSEDPAWSPDGRQIVFQSSRDGNFEIHTLNVEATLQGRADPDPVRLTDNRVGDFWPSWGPKTPAAATKFSLEKSPQEFGTGTYQIGLGDLDGDGDLDAVFANPQQHNSEVWLNEGDGTFVDTGQKLTPYGHGVGVADFDGDGDLDAFITCHFFVSPSHAYLNDGNGSLQDTGQDLGDAGISGTGLNLVDLDADGNMDVHVVYYDPQGLPDRVYLSDGAGGFSDSGLALDEETLAWGDLDADGDVDYMGKRYGEGYVVWLNDGSGHLSEGWNMKDAQTMEGGIALGDFDGDSDLDAMVANGFRTGGSHPTILLWNDGSGQFSDSGFRFNATMGADFGVGDLDGDGDLDLFVSNFDLPNEVWLNDGEGRFRDSGLRLGQARDTSTKPSLGDLDGDGDLDVLVGSLAGRPEVWFNTTPAGESRGPEGENLYLGQVPPGPDIAVFAPGIVSIEEGKEYKIAFSPDLQEIVFTRRTPGGRDDRLWVSRLENGRLTTPEMAPFTYDGFETDACFTADGSRLYFNSWRPLPGEAAVSNRPNVWFVDRTEQGWSEPQFYGPPLNDYMPVYFSIAADGTLYFTRTSPREIWFAELEDGQYLKAQRLPDEINYLKDVAHPAIAPDESYIIVDSYVEEGSRLVGYLYISFQKPDGSWTEAASLRDALKASETDVHASPRITPDGKYLFFEAYDVETDSSDIYWVSTEVIEALRSEALD